MKSVGLIILILMHLTVSAADTTKAKLYDPKADAVKDIENAITKAKVEKNMCLYKPAVTGARGAFALMLMLQLLNRLIRC